MQKDESLPEFLPIIYCKMEKDNEKKLLGRNLWQEENVIWKIFSFSLLFLLFLSLTVNILLLLPRGNDNDTVVVKQEEYPTQFYQERFYFDRNDVKNAPGDRKAENKSGKKKEEGSEGEQRDDRKGFARIPWNDIIQVAGEIGTQSLEVQAAIFEAVKNLF